MDELGARDREAVVLRFAQERKVQEHVRNAPPNCGLQRAIVGFMSNCH